MTERTEAATAAPATRAAAPAPAPAGPNRPPAAEAGREEPPRNRRRIFAVGGVLLVLAVVGVAWGAHYLTVSRWHVETEDAYVQGHIVQITPQVGGTALEVPVEDTQYVEAGQVLVRLDPADAQVALAQAEAQLAQTVREVRVTFANNGALAAAIQAREADVRRFTADAERAAADLQRARADLARRNALAPVGAVSGEELQHARSAVSNAQAAQSAAQAAGAAARSALAGAREQLATNQALTDGTTIDTHPNVRRAASRVREAMLALDRVVIRAPVSGYVARKGIQVGQRVAAGAPLMTVVPLDQVWVEANFKESQLRDLRIGQPVALTADAYGGRVGYRGRIAGLSAGTGAAFAILPAQNATGNWIKIVQRVPVRVALDAEQVRANPLRIGLSMVASVDTHDRAGAAVAGNDFTPFGSAVAATRTTDTPAAPPPAGEVAGLGPAPAASTPATASSAAATAATPVADAVVAQATGSNDTTEALIARIIRENLGSRP